MERVYIIHEMIGWVCGCAYMCVLVWSTSSSASLRLWCSSHWLRPQPTRGTRHTMQKHASQQPRKMICKGSPVVPWLLIECSHQYWTFGLFGPADSVTIVSYPHILPTTEFLSMVFKEWMTRTKRMTSSQKKEVQARYSWGLTWQTRFALRSAISI